MTPWSDPQTTHFLFLAVGGIGVLAAIVAPVFDRGDVAFVGLAGVIAVTIGLGLGG